MSRLNRQFALLLILLASLFALPGARAQLKVVGDGGPGPVKADHLTAELVSLGPAIAPGGKQTIGLVLTLEEHWHVYWVNAGDSGEPPHIKWTAPKSLTIGPMQFATPAQLPLGPLMDFGYEDVAAFPFTVTAAPGARPGPAHLDAQVSWLVCAQVCIPGKAHLGLDLPIAAGAPREVPPGALVGALGEAVNNEPASLPGDAKLSVIGGKTDYVLTLTAPGGDLGGEVNDAGFYPHDPDLIQNAADQPIEKLPDGIRLRIKRAPETPALPATLHGVIKLSDKLAYDFTVPVVPGEVAPPPAALAGASARSAAASAQAGGFGQVALMIGLALVGGVILNLMPCVFPVLFLKGLALVQSSGEERKRMRAHGFVYTLGILVSFWAIVAVLLVLRSGGHQAGWGFQLQNPIFIALLASGLFFFALSLAGQFDLGLSLTTAGDSLARKEGFAGSFFTGVLATIVATPCTAPLMGTAIGFALVQPPLITFAIFTALGFGLALPYLLLTLQPAWTRLLPRPGAWMEVLKQLTAVPLFGTAIWLTWVYGQLFVGDRSAGVDHMAELLFCFLVLAIAGWALGRWPNKTGSAIAAAVLAVAAVAIPLSQAKQASGSHAATAAPATTSTGLTWRPFTQSTLDQARASGHPVFIDFTAAWCLSCKVNERVVLEAEDVDQQLAGHNFVLLRADWTNSDPEISKQLASVGRDGVPTYVLYPAGSTSTADVLPELLTKSVVLDAIKRDAK